jgi:non-lysosomal glucosylceramidase
MSDKAWIMLEGMYDLLYNEMGLAFQIPEAIKNTTTYRSLGYMRPLCIWSIPFALKNIN